MADYTPRVWIGCLACYNEGRLVGDWHDATGAGDVTPKDVHGKPTSHDELWCFDHENIPVSGELDPLAAQSWGDLLSELYDCETDGFLAWAKSDVAREDEDAMPDVEAFRDAYCGEWSTFKDYAVEMVAELGYLDGVHEFLTSYFDYDQFARDLAMDYHTEPATDGGVHVFRQN